MSRSYNLLKFSNGLGPNNTLFISDSGTNNITYSASNIVNWNSMTDTFNFWKDNLVIMVSASNQFRANSAKYESTYQTLRQLSAAWNSTFNTVSSLSAYWNNVNFNGTIYDSTYTTVRLNSAAWTYLGPEGLIYTTLLNNSSKWESVSSFF